MNLWLVDWRKPLTRRARKTIVIRFVVMHTTREGAIELARIHCEEQGGGTFSARPMSPEAVVMVNSFSVTPTEVELSCRNQREERMRNHGVRGFAPDELDSRGEPK